MFFQPYSDYVITRQIYNERDFGQRYVKAWVSDASNDEAITDPRTQTVLSGVEMTEVDSLGKFKYSFRLPGDPIGTGRQLRIKTVVYTDDTYAEKDPNYNVEETNIVVRELDILGGGGSGVDYDYLEKVVTRIVKENQPALPETVDLLPLEKRINGLQDAIIGVVKGIKMPQIPTEIEKTVIAWQKPESVDLEPILEDLADTKKTLVNAIKDKEVTKVDLSKLEKSIKSIEENQDKANEYVKNIPAVILPYNDMTMPKIKETLDKKFGEARLETLKDQEPMEKAIYNIEDKVNEK